jgi:hypothetical protein
MPKVVRDFLVLNLELFNLKIRRVSKKNATVSNLHTMIVISHPQSPIPNRKWYHFQPYAGRVTQQSQNFFSAFCISASCLYFVSSILDS